MFVDKLGRAFPGFKDRVLQHVDQKVFVCFDAINGGFFESPQGFSSRVLKAAAEGRALDQQTVIIGRDDRARKAVTAIQADAGTAGRAIDIDLAGIGHKVKLGIFGGDTALDGVAPSGDVRLTLNVDFVGIEGIAFGDEDLSLDDIDAGDQLGDGMFHLNPRIHFDEVVITVFINEKLDGAGTAVFDGFCQSDGIDTNAVSLEIGQEQRRRKLDDLLMSSLNGAIPFKKMDNVAVVVPENLNFNVLGLFQVFFDKYRSIAESFGRFTDSGVIFFEQFLFVTDDAHPAAAATCRRL